jgi:orotidine-5'-phosphate decarboxylase
MPDGFAEALTSRVAARESQIVLGLDPDPARLWPSTRDESARPVGVSRADRAAAAVRSHCAALIDAAGPACVAVKPQMACFERLGAPGWAALGAVVDDAHAAGLLVIVDGKRGDVPVTATAYGQALAGSVPTGTGEIGGLGADAFTANPLLGSDSLGPLIATGAGVFVLVRTSNPGAADVQDLELADGTCLWERLAQLVDALGTTGPSGLSNVGAVFGATVPEHLGRARELMPRAVFLLPGVGAQGGRVEDLAAAFAPARAGGLIAASRSIATAYETTGGDPGHAARGEAERLRALAWSLT